MVSVNDDDFHDVEFYDIIFASVVNSKVYPNFEKIRREIVEEAELSLEDMQACIKAWKSTFAHESKLADSNIVLKIS